MDERDVKKETADERFAAEMRARIASLRTEDAAAQKRKTDLRDLDEFWEIDELVPKTRTGPRRAPGATDTAEITFGAEREGSGGDVPLNLNPKEGEVLVRHFVPQHGSAGEVRTEAPAPPAIAYENEGSLVHGVRIFVWESRYHYYRDFCEDAARYLSAEPEDGEAPPETVPFFSYVPQYSQMNDRQRAFYFYWRREFRRGRVLPVDDSYLYLYVYEILNTAGHETSPEEGLTMLYRLFFTYGKKNARLSRLLSEWIVDYSLIFRLPVPESARADAEFYRLFGATLKEFFVPSPKVGAAGYAEHLLRFCSAYDYRKSHFYTEQNRAYFDRYLPGALAAVIAQYSDGSHLFASAGMRDSRMVRSAFEQALCSYRIRYRIEVDYASFSRSHEMRYLVSDVLKWTENRLRGFLGVKSRLTAYSLPNDVRACIDRYCDENFPRKSAVHAQKPKEDLPSYEKLYDLPETPLSIEHAAQIERASWETTRRLTEAFSDGEAPDVPAVSEPEGTDVPSPQKSSPPTEKRGGPSGGDPSDIEANTNTEPNTDTKANTGTEVPSVALAAEDEAPLRTLLGTFYPFAEAAYRGDSAAQSAVAAALGMLPDLVADRINELAADELGDILLVDGGEGFEVIDEYRALFRIP